MLVQFWRYWIDNPRFAWWVNLAKRLAEAPDFAETEALIRARKSHLDDVTAQAMKLEKEQQDLSAHIAGIRGLQAHREHLERQIVDVTAQAAMLENERNQLLRVAAESR